MTNCVRLSRLSKRQRRARRQWREYSPSRLDRDAPSGPTASMQWFVDFSRLRAAVCIILEVVQFFNTFSFSFPANSQWLTREVSRILSLSHSGRCIPVTDVSLADA